MSRYVDHWRWWLKAESIPERWIGGGLGQENGEVERVTRMDWHARGWGPDDAPPYPQDVDATQSGRECPAYQRLMRKAAQVITDERLERAPRLDHAALLEVIATMKARRNEHSGNNTV